MSTVPCTCPRYGDQIFARSPRCLVHGDVVHELVSENTD